MRKYLSVVLLLLSIEGSVFVSAASVAAAVSDSAEVSARTLTLSLEDAIATAHDQSPAAIRLNGALGQCAPSFLTFKRHNVHVERYRLKQMIQDSDSQ